MTDNSEPQVSEDGEQVVSESQIAVHWREEEYYYPAEAFVAQHGMQPTPPSYRPAQEGSHFTQWRPKYGR